MGVNRFINWNFGRFNYIHLREKLSNLVIEPVILERYFLTKVLEVINLEEDKYGDEKIIYLRELIKINQKTKTSILPLGNISIGEIEKFKEICMDSSAKIKKIH